MRRIICKQTTTQAGTTTLTLERGGATFVIKNIPAQVCPNCGEAYLDEQVAAQVLDTASNSHFDFSICGFGVKFKGIRANWRVPCPILSSLTP